MATKYFVQITQPKQCPCCDAQTDGESLRIGTLAAGRKFLILIPSHVPQTINAFFVWLADLHYRIITEHGKLVTIDELHTLVHDTGGHRVEGLPPHGLMDWYYTGTDTYLNYGTYAIAVPQ